MGEAKRRGAKAMVRRLHAPSKLGPITRFVFPPGTVLAQRAPPPELAALAEGVRARVRDALIRGSAERSLERMLDAIDATGRDCQQSFDSSLAEAASHDAARGRALAAIACRSGCAFCCHVEVDVTPLEAIRLARAAGRAPAASVGRRPPCPLLEDGACSHYERRPYACRAAFSPDAARCEAGYMSDAVVSVPSLDWPRHLAAGYVTGELAALSDLKLESRRVELRRALQVLAEEGALLRWLNGGEIFPHRA